MKLKEPGIQTACTGIISEKTKLDHIQVIIASNFSKYWTCSIHEK